MNMAWLRTVQHKFVKTQAAYFDDSSISKLINVTCRYIGYVQNFISVMQILFPRAQP